MSGITTLFNTFVFPVALCILLIWFFFTKVWTKIEITLERVTKTNESLSKTNEILAKKLDKKIDNIDTELKEIKEYLRKE